VPARRATREWPRLASCSHCGATLPKESRYCPQCGNRAVEHAETQPRYYGITPASLVLLLGLAALAGAVVLFVTGEWPFALIVLGVAVLLLLLSLETARRKSEHGVGRTSAEALDAFRTRAGVAAESAAARGRAAGRLLTLRRELQRMGQLRSRLLFELGDAVYRSDEQGIETAREQLKELDALAAEREAEMNDIVAQTQERLDQRRLEVQPTEMVELPEDPSPPPGEVTPPEPARIPEPYPPPDEADPPEPVVIPEPGPLPSEGDERR
jgi:predicted RNA-binding Zn-ribbon protein involved in translation (DUF1610 family)